MRLRPLPAPLALAFAGAAAVFGILLAVRHGAVPLTRAEFLAALSGSGTGPDRFIITGLRGPRALMAGLRRRRTRRRGRDPSGTPPEPAGRAVHPGDLRRCRSRSSHGSRGWVDLGRFPRAPAHRLRGRTPGHQARIRRRLLRHAPDERGRSPSRRGRRGSLLPSMCRPGADTCRSEHDPLGPPLDVGQHRWRQLGGR